MTARIDGVTELTLREQVQLDAEVIGDIMWQGERITNMLNQAQDWLQIKLIKQGFMNWKEDSTVGSVTGSTILGITTGKVIIPVDTLRDMPMEQFFPDGGTTEVLAPAVEVKYKNFSWVVNNPVSAPSLAYPIVCITNGFIHIYPIGDNDSVIFSSTKKITDLVYNSGSSVSEIPVEHQWILIERVVMQIKSIEGNEQVKQAKVAEIDNELTRKYQLDALVEKDSADRSQPQ